MSARFLVRLDDICPTMNWDIWNQVESTLQRRSIKPILAIVPDNRDPKLIVDAPKADFWMRVRDWQARGWTIALHGYQHAYVTQHAGLIGLNAYSEFAGLSYQEQTLKIEAALAILDREHVKPAVWIAPAHTFDQTTVRILVEHGIHVISDGFYFRPITKLEATWIPQQLWSFRRLPAGLWTVCFHPNDFSESRIRQFDLDIERFQSAIVSVPDVLKTYAPKPENRVDAWFSRFWLRQLKKRRTT
jgi:predicted deacetylase